MAERSLTVAAVIVAAGRARRFGDGENKVWRLLGDRSIAEWSVAAFDTHPRVDGIVVVAAKGEEERAGDMCGSFEKVVRIVTGAATRAGSVKQGLEAVPDTTDYVLVHDAARPLIGHDVIDRVIDATVRVGGAVPGIPVSDCLKRVDTTGAILATIPRHARHAGSHTDGITAVQTPQGARLSALRHAYSQPGMLNAPDEAAALEASGQAVVVVTGDVTNIKITRAEDLDRARAVIGTKRTGRRRQHDGNDVPAPAAALHAVARGTVQPDVRTGFGYDVHAFALPAAGRALVLGGVHVDHKCGLTGHSDADVVLHAICDALLGAAALGDIGIRFPDTEAAYEGISSLKLLAAVRELLTAAGWMVVNVDVTIAAETPRIAPHREPMRAAISRELGISPDRVSIKATTSEGMGFVGRCEGIECWAVATVRQGCVG